MAERRQHSYMDIVAIYLIILCLIICNSSRNGGVLDHQTLFLKVQQNKGG